MTSLRSPSKSRGYQSRRLLKTREMAHERRLSADSRYRFALRRERSFRRDPIEPDAAATVGTIVNAIVPFHDATGWKQRPFIVLAVNSERVFGVPCTSKVRTPRVAYQVLLDAWESEGLAVLTAANVRRPMTLPPDWIGERIGRLCERDLLNVVYALPSHVWGELQRPSSVVEPGAELCSGAPSLHGLGGAAHV